jgi:hypothetical protein
MSAAALREEALTATLIWHEGTVWARHPDGRISLWGRRGLNWIRDFCEQRNVKLEIGLDNIRNHDLPQATYRRQDRKR